MNFSIKATIRALLAPEHRIFCDPARWTAILGELNRRGEDRHEAGAFLLGEPRGSRLAVSDAIYYDDLDPAAYSSGVCILHAPAFAKLWSICRERRLSVVADIHTHPGAAFQSWSDRDNPMVARQGHIAIIVPNYANKPINMQRLGVFEYIGDHVWTDRSPSRSPNFLFITRWI